MATESKVHVTPSVQPEFAVANLSAETAELASRILSENHEKFHIYFNDAGFHNHIVHHVLTSFALGAGSETIQKHYDNNTNYQRPNSSLDDKVVQDLGDPTRFLQSLCDPSHYHDYLVFFQKEIAEKGYEEVVNEYVFKGDERANIIFGRMFAGLLHPIIHLGFGIEFKQPAVVAEALAQAAIHPNELDQYFIEVEEKAKQNQYPSDSLVNILDKIRADEKLRRAASFDDVSSMSPEGVLVRGGKDEMIKYASQWRIDPDQLEEATAEMTHAAAYFTGASQHPPKQVKFDFFYMHSVTSSIFFSSFIKQSWISTANKTKLLEYKSRIDLFTYVCRGAPQPLLDEITQYVPKQPSSASDWNPIIERAKIFEDDGHASKLVRALANAERICAPWEKSEKFRIKGDMWLKLGNMAIDSVEDSGEKWVYSTGFDEAWKDFENRPSPNGSL